MHSVVRCTVCTCTVSKLGAPKSPALRARCARRWRISKLLKHNVEVVTAMLHRTLPTRGPGISKSRCEYRLTNRCRCFGRSRTACFRRLRSRRYSIFVSINPGAPIGAGSRASPPRCTGSSASLACCIVVLTSPKRCAASTASRQPCARASAPRRRWRRGRARYRTPTCSPCCSCSTDPSSRRWPSCVSARSATR